MELDLSLTSTTHAFDTKAGRGGGGRLKQHEHGPIEKLDSLVAPGVAGVHDAGPPWVGPTLQRPDDDGVGVINVMILVGVGVCGLVVVVMVVVVVEVGRKEGIRAQGECVMVACKRFGDPRKDTCLRPEPSIQTCLERHRGIQTQTHRHTPTHPSTPTLTHTHTETGRDRAPYGSPCLVDGALVAVVQEDAGLPPVRKRPAPQPEDTHRFEARGMEGRGYVWGSSSSQSSYMA
jgi:hypothetical protein